MFPCYSPYYTAFNGGGGDNTHSPLPLLSVGGVARPHTRTTTTGENGEEGVAIVVARTLNF